MPISPAKQICAVNKEYSTLKLLVTDCGSGIYGEVQLLMLLAKVLDRRYIRIDFVTGSNELIKIRPAVSVL
jgi:hypothetical protein